MDTSSYFLLVMVQSFDDRSLADERHQFDVDDDAGKYVQHIRKPVEGDLK